MLAQPCAGHLALFDLDPHSAAQKIDPAAGRDHGLVLCRKPRLFQRLRHGLVQLVLLGRGLRYADRAQRADYIPHLLRLLRHRWPPPFVCVC